MTDESTNIPPERRSLVAVYPSQEAVDLAVRAVRELGVPEDAVHIGDDARPEDSLIAEMQQEADDSLMSPQAGALYPKEAARSLTVLGLPITVLFAIVALPFAFIPFGETPLWLRLIVMAGIGAVCGGTIAIIVGPAPGAKRPDEPLAAQRGAVVRVDRWSEPIEESLRRSELIRLDIVDREGRENGWTVATEDRSGGRGIIDEIKRNTDDPHRENVPGSARPAHGGEVGGPTR